MGHFQREFFFSGLDCFRMFAPPTVANVIRQPMDRSLANDACKAKKKCNKCKKKMQKKT